MTNIQQSSGSAFNESVALNAYAIVNATSLEWDVKVYRFKRADGQPMAHGDRGGIKNAVWTLKKFPESRCSGYYGYIIDISQDEIAVPSRWELACGKVADGYVADLAKDYRARAVNPDDHAVVNGILREAIKKRKAPRTVFTITLDRYGRIFTAIALRPTSKIWKASNIALALTLAQNDLWGTFGQSCCKLARCPLTDAALGIIT